MTALLWRSKGARISPSETLRGTPLPSSSTSTKGTTKTDPPGPPASTLLNEQHRERGKASWEEGELFAEAIVVLGGDLFGVFMTRPGCVIRLAASLHGSWFEQDPACQADPDKQDKCSGALSIFHRHLLQPTSVRIHQQEQIIGT